MTAKELKDKVDFYVSRGHEDDVVLITLANRSIGGRASTAVQNVVTGFDWEHGQIRIEPEEKLYREGRTKSNPLKTINIKCIYDNCVAIKRHCPRCESSIRKDDCYCSKCGQKVVVTDEIRHEYDNRRKK